jgi:hypothetical protein
MIPSLNLYVSDNLSVSYTLDMQGVNYGIMLQIDEVQLKPNNSYQDQMETTIFTAPKELMEERDGLVQDLLKKKEKLMKQIDERKAEKESKVDK